MVAAGRWCLLLVVVMLHSSPSNGWLSNFGFNFKKLIDLNIGKLLNQCKNKQATGLNGRSHADIVAAAKLWAPVVRLAVGEEWKPSSVDYFLQHVNLRGGSPTSVTPSTLPTCNSNCYLETKTHLSCPSCREPVVFKGQDPASAPAYAIYEDKGNVVEITYWFFFPYNRGKRACVGLYFDNVCPCVKAWGHCLCPRLNGCAGGYSTFGNHVGDWEHVKIKFNNNKIYSIYLSIHDSEITNQYGGEFLWNGNEFRRGNRAVYTTDCTHAQVYAAKGSHGIWPNTGEHVYKKLFNGDKLKDHCSAGTAWHIANNLKIVKMAAKGQFTGEFNFLNFKGRWGNRERNCPKIIGQCVLENGPGGPPK
ncbi:putative vacuolar protein sorting-associated protein TDA6 [Lingula anatina]|uniref:Vacuolar protein sorting-associated protein TDA6 n=1 Tax=Lingula anatina TaxID=7574 RepID=A0A1S3JI13_LINAN|nr:putative vacuolar protein sorting-associated protein TDA6 [Lingula anatina]|eukprot:XP_013410003.1 putative vacuolar protein sorting-associated protein TDA6 [Lingula anatina]